MGNCSTFAEFHRGLKALGSYQLHQDPAQGVLEFAFTSVGNEAQTLLETF